MVRCGCLILSGYLILVRPSKQRMLSSAMTDAGPTSTPKSLSKRKPIEQPQQFIGLIEREGMGYVALCPELDVASQGNTVEEARLNLIEAIELFFQAADPSQIQNRLHKEVFVTHV
jgi:predicted RNase H-like HicB family nuclease